VEALYLEVRVPPTAQPLPLTVQPVPAIVRLVLATLLQAQATAQHPPLTLPLLRPTAPPLLATLELAPAIVLTHQAILPTLQATPLTLVQAPCHQELTVQPLHLTLLLPLVTVLLHLKQAQPPPLTLPITALLLLQWAGRITHRAALLIAPLHLVLVELA